MPPLDAERWRRLSPLLDRALELDGETRAAWLASLRVDEPTAADLQRLLEEHDAVVRSGFLDTPCPIEGTQAGRTVGAYTLTAPLGEGGMGTVWLAERSDGRFTRRAAVKFPRLALTRGYQERFRREVSFLGRLTHPNIAQLVDAGVTADGQPYLILEHVPGEPIDAYCASRALPEEARVGLVCDVLAALAHAHANLIVHRDLKPSNVLVTADGRVKLLDFGIAKLLSDEGAPADATLLTQDNGTALTPAFAAPEQLTGGAVTTATDVYAAGVLLYQLVAGRHPAGADAQTPAALVRAIVEREPEGRLRGDLDTIVRKALKKSPAERYASATAFADDLQRYLHHEPISARRDALAYRAGKFLRRNRAASALAAVALAATTAGIVGTLLQARTARRQRDFALHELARAQATNDLDAFVLSDAAPAGERFTVDDLLSRAEHMVERRRGDTATEVDLMVSIGRQYTVLDQYEKARGILERAYTLSRGVPDPGTRARAACGLAQTLANVGAIPRAETLLAEGLRGLPPDAMFAADRVNCLLRGSEIANRRGLAADELSRAQSAAALARRMPVPSELIELDAGIDLASAYAHAGRYQQAAATFAQAAGRLASLGRDDTERAATLFNNWGLALSLASRPLEAAPILQRAIDIERDSGGEARVSPVLLTNYARVLQDLDEFDRAADYADRAYAKARGAGAQVAVSQVELVQSAIARSQGDLPRAAQLLADSEAWVRRTLRPGHVAFASIALQHAELDEARGDLPSALDQAGEAVAIADASIASRGDGLYLLPIALIRRARIELDRGRAEDAAADARRARQVAAEAGEPSMSVGRADVALGLALRALGQTAAAREALRAGADELRRAGGATHPEARQAEQLASR